MFTFSPRRRGCGASGCEYTTNPDHRFHVRTPVPEPQTRDRPQARRLRPPLRRTGQARASSAFSSGPPSSPRTRQAQPLNPGERNSSPSPKRRAPPGKPGATRCRRRPGIPGGEAAARRRAPIPATHPMRGDSRLALPRPRRWRRTRPATRSPSGHLPRPAPGDQGQVGAASTARRTSNKPAVAPQAATRKCGRSPSSAHAPSRPRRETGPRAPPAGGAARGVRGQPPRPAGEGLGSALARRTPQGCGVEDETPF